MHKIEVKKATNGIIITIGCQTFVETDIDRAMSELTRYLKDPEVVQAEYELKYGPFRVGVAPAECGNVGTWTVTLPGSSREPT